MWARVVELALGLGLVLAPELLAGPEGLEAWLTRLAGAGVMALAASSFHPRFRKAHLGLLPVSALLLAWGWLQTPRPASPWAQALLLAGLLLGLVALVPAPATQPPEGWRRHVEERED